MPGEIKKEQASITINYNGKRYIYNLKGGYKAIFQGDERLGSAKMPSLEDMKIEVEALVSSIFNIEDGNAVLESISSGVNRIEENS